VPFQGPKADLPGTPEGVRDAYFAYPSKLVKSVTRPVGQGDDITLFSNVPQAPLPLEQNPVWQKVNKDLNVNWKLNLAATSADAAQKLGAMVAGNDIPDVIFLGPVSGASLGNVPAFLAAKCADLTPYLAGDAIKDFPNLANLPPYLWHAPGVVYDRKIYGVPVAQGRVGTSLSTNQHLLDSAGVGPIRSADDFKRALQAVTRPEKGVYGLVDMLGFQFSPYLAAQVFGAPNGWAVDQSGKLLKDWETDEFKAGLSWLRDLWMANLINPNSLKYNNVTAAADFAAGTSVFHFWMGVDMDWESANKLNPSAKVLSTPPFSADGKARPQFYLGAGNFGASVLKLGSPERVREVLGLLNYSAAPFGSEEQLLQRFGIEDADYTLTPGGNPVPVSGGYASNPLPFIYMCRGPAVAYTPTRSRDFAQLTHDAESTELPIGIVDPTNGGYSQTNGSQGASLRQTIADAINDIVAGRRPLSDWDGVVTDWRAKGGDKIRDEFQRALAAATT
jgi:putative aldouronate transport system substrate-binding protein